MLRWRASAPPSTPLPGRGVGRARWRLELRRSRGGESREFEVEACDAQGWLCLQGRRTNLFEQHVEQGAQLFTW
jgi:protein ImuA